MPALKKEKVEHCFFLEKKGIVSKIKKNDGGKFFHQGADSDCKFSLRDLFLPSRFSFGFSLKKSLLAFTASGFMAVAVVGGASYADKGMEVKSEVMNAGDQAYGNMMEAINGIKNSDFESSLKNFEQAQKNFNQASDEMEELGNAVISISKYFPFASKLSSGKNLIEAGNHLAVAGKNLNLAAEKMYKFKKKSDENNLQNISLLDIFTSIQEDLKVAGGELQKAREKIDQVKLDDLPEEKRQQFADIKSKMIFFSGMADDFSENSHILVDLLGGNGPRKYLFLFQNNNEMRATGGFIGSYGLLEISSGKVRNFFIDGIFNPDGQLREKIVPPKPIQKISAAWSLHDSNWFPDFPVSAEKAILFYEKTGGPTVDGVIAITPAVMEKLLTLVGPIEMPEYGTTLTADNFTENTQYEVEVDYDKKENNPKKILSDLAPMVLNRLTSSGDPKIILGALDVFLQSLSEKHILFYSRNDQLQDMISNRGWSGEILQTQGDYLSVINSNINGYKTDGVVDENIEHTAEIQADGSIIDTMVINRKHTGGNSQFDWWNKVNSNYMRVYVPLGTQLIEIEGQTVEFDKSPLDYQALKFNEDPDVKKEEENMQIDQNNGIRTYQDAGKTVFAFWTYVSPQEEIAVKLKYRLPFKLNFENDYTNSYSLLAQKQSGSNGSGFSSTIKYPDGYKIEWSYPDNIDKSEGKLKLDEKLDQDQFLGAVMADDKISVK
ncbi:MAG: Uncharacterized protein Athens071425_9 [Parcubacteria group bacterium Athens0714_25]|nr:MAG: Uncharacterized protein Athens071425_9 [Parcubacteria group bacterium Athens0714_25]